MPSLNDQLHDFANWPFKNGSKRQASDGSNDTSYPMFLTTFVPALQFPHPKKNIQSGFDSEDYGFAMPLTL